ncbi:hypothetical protein V6N13_008305 [Hibiscus sabdariffa]
MGEQALLGLPQQRGQKTITIFVLILDTKQITPQISSRQPCITIEATLVTFSSRRHRQIAHLPSFSISLGGNFIGNGLDVPKANPVFERQHHRIYVVHRPMVLTPSYVIHEATIYPPEPLVIGDGGK